jgi:hypothetical protein
LFCLASAHAPSKDCALLLPCPSAVESVTCFHLSWQCTCTLRIVALGRACTNWENHFVHAFRQRRRPPGGESCNMDTSTYSAMLLRKAPFSVALSVASKLASDSKQSSFRRRAAFSRQASSDPKQVYSAHSACSLSMTSKRVSWLRYNNHHRSNMTSARH